MSLIPGVLEKQKKKKKTFKVILVASSLAEKYFNVQIPEVYFGGGGVC